MSEDLTLYHLETGLRDLIAYRAERMADTEAPPDAEELAALDAEIQRYEISAPAKVTRTVALRRSWQAQLDTILGPKDDKGQRRGGEVRRLKALAEHVQSQLDRLDDYLKFVLESQPEPKKGSRRLTGADGSSILLKTNGGVLPLVITDESLLPDECCRMEGWIQADVWKQILSMRLLIDSWDEGDCFLLKRVPDPGTIRAKLAEDCPECFGTGREHGCTDNCLGCGGSGKGSVAGAYLGERQQHVETR